MQRKRNPRSVNSIAKPKGDPTLDSDSIARSTKTLKPQTSRNAQAKPTDNARLQKVLTVTHKVD
jgi:hypothetical protein